MSSLRKILVFIPTYNEAENVEALFKQITALGLDTDILLMDDNSPDGTGKIIDGLVASDPSKIFALHRPCKLGIGSAHQDGIAWAYQRGYQILVTMDCDFTHSPEVIRDFLRFAADYDIVLGSRYMRKGSLREWNLLRKILTLTGHFLTVALLRMPQDATGAFRLYRLDSVPAGVFKRVHSAGYSFFFESLFILNINGFKIKEIPIDLPARTYGHSKMQLTHAIDSLVLLLRLSARKTFRSAELIHKNRIDKTNEMPPMQMQEEWDQYWSSKDRPVSTLYDMIAVVYRKLIIRPTLTHFISKYFKPQSKLLHAGCGSGQVDGKIAEWARISALDISPEALRIYKRTNPQAEQVMHGSIFEIPSAPATFDGVYNLGVMEHFTAEQIDNILREFYRVLKPGGRIVLFWPPSFGLTVRFLKVIHWVANSVFSSNLKLHPDEVTHISSKQQVQALLNRTGFSLIEMYFGARDCFTHAVVVAEKHSFATDAQGSATKQAVRAIC